MATKRAKRADTRNLLLRGRVWYIRAKDSVTGAHIVESTGETDLEAARAVRDSRLLAFRLKDERERAIAMQARVGAIDEQLARIEEATPSIALAAGWREYIAQQNRPDSGPATLAQYESTFEAFVAWMRQQHPDVIEMRHVGQEHADRYAAHLQGRVSAATVNRQLNALALVWRILQRPARLTGNPWKGITRRRHAPHSRRELTIEELQRLCSAAAGEMRLLLALGIYAGLRLADAALLRWESVDIARRLLSIIPRKTARRAQKRITLPIHPALLALLSESPAGRRRGYVMPRMAARYEQFSGALSKDIQELFLSCDIRTNTKSLTASERASDPPTLPKSKERARPDAGYHSLRHTFVSLCAAGGVPQSVVQSLVGHGSPAMTAHYTHTGTETARNAVALLPDVTGATALPHAPEAAQGALRAVLEALPRLDAQELKQVIKAARVALANKEARQ